MWNTKSPQQHKSADWVPLAKEEVGVEGRAGLITLSTDTFAMQRRERALSTSALENSIMSKHRPPGALGEDDGKKGSRRERIRRDPLSVSCSTMFKLC